MRIRTGHGPNDWTESTPASTGSSRLGGELVQGAPGPWEQGRINARAERAKVAALRAVDKLWTSNGDKRLGKPGETPENQVCQASESPEVSAVSLQP